MFYLVVIIACFKIFKTFFFKLNSISKEITNKIIYACDQKPEKKLFNNFFKNVDYIYLLLTGDLFSNLLIFAKSLVTKSFSFLISETCLIDFLFFKQSFCKKNCNCNKNKVIYTNVH